MSDRRYSCRKTIHLKRVLFLRMLNAHRVSSATRVKLKITSSLATVSLGTLYTFLRRGVGVMFGSRQGISEGTPRHIRSPSSRNTGAHEHLHEEEQDLLC